MTTERSGPERQCVSCRDRGQRDDLIRLVQAPDGTVVVDLKARLPGRGAWVHPCRECLQLTAKRGLLSRAFRGPVRADDLEVRVHDAVLAAMRDGLSLAAAGGGLVGGHDALVHAMREGRVQQVAVASDVAQRTRAALEAAAGGDVTLIDVPLDREALGAQIGASTRAAVGVLPVPATAHLRRQLQRLSRLG